jgi:CHAD domain-containing protein
METPMRTAAGHAEVAVITKKFELEVQTGSLDLGTVNTGTWAEPVTVTSRVTYYDTRRMRLARAGIRLARTTGSGDTGWSLTVPGHPGVHRCPAGVDDSHVVPAELVDRVSAWTRGRALRSMVELSRCRTIHRLDTQTDVGEIELDDDTVTARIALPHGPSLGPSWREVQCRLPYPTEVGDAVLRSIARAGGAPSNWTSQLDHALAGSLPRIPTAPTSELNGHRTAAAVLQEYLAIQMSAIVKQDYPARHDEPDGVHKMRVTSRRLRNALSTFRPLLERRTTDSLRGELTWLGGALGNARDAEVLRDRIVEGLRADPHSSRAGSGRAVIEVELRADHRRAHDRLQRILRSRRYYRLLDRLDRFVSDPPFKAIAGGRASNVLAKPIRRSYRRLSTLVVAGPPTDPRDLDPWLHKIRKAAKQLRYTAEAVQGAFGSPTTTLARRAAKLQEVLGEHQDSVIARQALSDVCLRVKDTAGAADAIAHLQAREQARAEGTVIAFDDAWLALSREWTRFWVGRADDADFVPVEGPRLRGIGRPTTL